jgi:hypothetical protein
VEFQRGAERGLAVSTPWSKQLRIELTRGAKWVLGRLDALAALLTGGVAAVLAATGDLAGQDLAAVTLTVLTVVALSLVVERGLRLKASHGIEEVLDELHKTRDAVRVLESGSPYHVVESESTWDIQDDGTAKLLRRKRLRFAQDDVVTVLDWLKADGKVNDIKYRPLPGRRIHTYDSDGRKHTLVALDRPYGRDEELDFYIERTIEQCFVKSPDRTTVHALESTSLIRMTVRWPVARPPRAVRFYRRTDAERRKPVVPPVVKGPGGHMEVTIEAQDPGRGERICLEWDWEPPLSTANGGGTSNGMTVAAAPTSAQPPAPN